MACDCETSLRCKKGPHALSRGGTAVKRARPKLAADRLLILFVTAEAAVGQHPVSLKVLGPASPVDNCDGTREPPQLEALHVKRVPLRSMFSEI